MCFQSMHSVCMFHTQVLVTTDLPVVGTLERICGYHGYIQTNIKSDYKNRKNCKHRMEMIQNLFSYCLAGTCQPR